MSSIGFRSIRLGSIGMGSIRWARWGGLLAMGAGLLLPAGRLFAQRGAGIGGGAPVAGVGAPGGVEEKDELRGFHRAIAMQATSEQTAQFREIVKKTETARGELDRLASSLESGDSAKNADEWSTRVAALRQELEVARTETGKFVNGFSLAQKNGLKETAAKLMKAEVELGEQEKALDARGERTREERTPGDQAGGNQAREERARMAGGLEGLRKALANFRSEQDSLAVEMGMVMSESTAQAAFNVPARKSSVTIGGVPVGITTSATITRASSGISGGDNLYEIQATTELAELQENMGAILGATMNKEERCGERIRVKEADLTPEIPLVRALVRVHYERWLCSAGHGGDREMTEGDATVEMKVTADLGAGGQVRISSQIGHVEAERFLADLLKTGTLGDELKENMSSAVMAAVSNLKTIVPAAGDAVSARSVRFGSPRESELSVVVGGEMRMSDAQAKEMERQVTAGTLAGRAK